MSRPSTIQRRSLSIVALLAVLVLVGCHDRVTRILQTSIDRIWSTPATKAAVQSTAREAVDTQLRTRLIGQRFGPWPGVEIRDIQNLSLYIGDFGPTVTVPTEPRFWSTSTDLYLLVPFNVDWRAGNGVRVSARVITGWWTPNFDMRSGDATAIASGTCLFRVSRDLRTRTKTITISSASVTARTTVRVWGITINVSRWVQDALNERVLQPILGRAFESALFESTRR